MIPARLNNAPIDLQTVLMNEREFHQQTIRGLIQTTVNRTHLDLERRGLIPVGTPIDWTNIRVLIQGIEILFTQQIQSEGERIAIRNLAIEIRTKLDHFTAVIQNFDN